MTAPDNRRANYEAIDYRAIEEHLARIKKEAPLPATVAFGGYSRAAAVLSTFDETLVPALPIGDESFADVLDNAQTVRDDAGNTRYRVDAAVRRRVLQSFEGIEALQAARAANQGAPVDALQQVFDACLNGSVPPLERAGETQLTALFEVASWLAGIVPGIPDQESIRAALDCVYLLAPFYDLVGDRFAGRSDELRQLRAYVGVLPTGSAWSWLSTRAADILDWHAKPPLAIYGPGGIGKSTLVAKFILDHTEVDEAKRFPFIYLDFDRPDLLAVEPLTILLEAVRQIGIQWPALRRDCEQLRQKWSQDIVRQQVIATSANKAAQARPGQMSAVTERRPFVLDFARLLSRAQIESRPILLVLDTFEEVQSRSDAAVEAICKFLEELQHEVPRLRTVFSGRAPIGISRPRSSRSCNWSPPLRRRSCAAPACPRPRRKEPPRGSAGTRCCCGWPPSFCTGWRPSTGKSAASRCSRRKRHVPGLRPAACRASCTHASSITSRTSGWKALAHPGMVLRRITPEIILEVLAGPCNVTVAGADDRCSRSFRRWKPKSRWSRPRVHARSGTGRTFAS